MNRSLLTSGVQCSEMTLSELRDDPQWWQIYEEAFPPDEIEPREVIEKSIQRGVGVALRASTTGRTVGMAAVHLLKSPPVVFLVYLAVAPDCQGQGVGGQLLETVWRLGRQRLQEQGLTASGLIWEIDSPEHAPDVQELQVRERRLEFFQRHGGELLSQSYFQPPLHGGAPVPMRLVYRPAQGAHFPDDDQIAAIIRAMYREKYHEINGIDCSASLRRTSVVLNHAAEGWR